MATVLVPSTAVAANASNRGSDPDRPKRFWERGVLLRFFCHRGRALDRLSVPFEASIFGVDSFQALAGGMRVLCAFLEKHEASLAFLDGPPGDCALPLIASCDPSLRAEAHEFIRSKIEHDLVSRRGRR